MNRILVLSIVVIGLLLNGILESAPRPTPTPTPSPAARAKTKRVALAKPSPSPIKINKADVVAGSGQPTVRSTTQSQNVRPLNSVSDVPIPNNVPPTMVQLPDLQVKSLELVGTQARVRVLNAGHGAAGSFNVRLFAGQPSKVSAIVASFDHKVGGVPPMTSIPVVIDVAPSKLVAGRVTVHLDSNNEVKETNEGNNSASK